LERQSIRPFGVADAAKFQLLIYMAKTSRDAHRHIRELSKLFSDANTVGSAMVEEFLKRKKERKYLKQSLRRLIEREFLVRDGEEFTPTAKGLIHFRKFQPTKRINPPTQVQWDRKWRLVSFDVPGCYSKKRDHIRSLLNEFNFYRLQKSVWICPSVISKKFWNILVKSDLDKYCKTMIVDIIEGDEDVKRYFKIVIGILLILFLPDLFSFF